VGIRGLSLRLRMAGRLLPAGIIGRLLSSTLASHLARQPSPGWAGRCHGIVSLSGRRWHCTDPSSLLLSGLRPLVVLDVCNAGLPCRGGPCIIVFSVWIVGVSQARRVSTLAYSAAQSSGAHKRDCRPHNSVKASLGAALKSAGWQLESSIWTALPGCHCVGRRWAVLAHQLFRSDSRRQ
jgi:hypothetical protein